MLRSQAGAVAGYRKLARDREGRPALLTTCVGWSAWLLTFACAHGTFEEGPGSAAPPEQSPVTAEADPSDAHAGASGASDEADAPEVQALLCPESRSCGCDSDNDGTPDCEDICPENPQFARQGSIVFNIVASAEKSEYASYFPDIERCLRDAGAAWASHLVVPWNVTIEVAAHVDETGYARGSSANGIFLRYEQDFAIYEPSVANEIRTGIDPNGDHEDATVTFGINALRDNYWFDPDFKARTAPVPEDKVDVFGTCMHELGHVLAFNGYRDSDGTYLGAYASPFDWASFIDSDNLFFGGNRAMQAYGNAIPRMHGNVAHLGNEAPRPGTDLVTDLMYGIAPRAIRRFITNVHLGVLTDVGLPVRGTEAARKLCDATAFRHILRREPAPAPAPPPIECE